MSEQVYRRRREIPGMDPVEDVTLSMLVALTSEFAVLRERLDTLEAVLEKQGAVHAEAIEAYVPDADAVRRREGLRQRLIEKVFGPLRDLTLRACQKGETA